MTTTTCVICGNNRPTAKTGKHIGWCKTCRWYQTPTGRKRRAMQDGKNITTTAQDEHNKRAYHRYLAARRKRLARHQTPAGAGEQQ